MFWIASRPANQALESQRMKLLVKVEGGPSPGVTVAGEQKDIIALAEQIKSGAMSKSEGLIPIDGAHVEGEPHEWIAFEVVKSFPRARDDQRVKARL
ncbi:MAG: hypothetical protein SFY80_07885 [Verrucomicrobiota bacterium]|nr:hypothetical protein [Verrucomicrobiota bacterium]